jgi:hypothetical protein
MPKTPPTTLALSSLASIALVYGLSGFVPDPAVRSVVAHVGYAVAMAPGFLSIAKSMDGR